MAKDKQKDQNEEQPKKKGGLLKLLILGVLVLGVLGGGGFFAYQYFLAPKNEDKNATAKQDNATAKQGEGEQAKPETLQTQVISLPTLVVNLADPLGRRYLKLSADLEITSQVTSQQVQDNMPKIKDSLILLLSSKTYEQLASIEQKLLLKKEIVARLNQIMGKPVVKRVYFTEFIVQ